MAIQSAVDVCNSALQKVGAASIISLSDNSRSARACAQAYDTNRRSELRKHHWNFAMKRVVLAPDATAPAFDYLYQFTLPSDCLKVILPPDDTIDWVIESGKLLTNNGTSVNLRYIADVTDPTKWDAAFYDMVSIATAIDIVEVITNSTAKMQALEKAYKDALNEARRNNAFEQLPADGPDDSFWTVRF